ncbi:MAG: hypothetical protein KC464_25120, partial [Myxococcales bacterium]|nr:hypothetical protein [Myxococcales bacterium]
GGGGGGGGATGADADCAHPERAFDRAWSAATRRKVIDRLGSGDSMAAVAILDESRRQWIAAYTEACAMPAGTRRQVQLDCLRGAREEAVAVGQTVAAGDLLEPATLAIRLAGVFRCGGDDGP